MNTPEEMFKAVGLENPHDKDSNTRGCKDGGTCHHKCEASCFREVHCSPLGGSNLDHNWQPLKLSDFEKLQDELSRTKADLAEAESRLGEITDMVVDTDCLDERETLMVYRIAAKRIPTK